MAGYDFKRLVYGAIIFTAFMYLILLATMQLASNYDRDTEEIGRGGLFDSDSWIMDETDYDEVKGIRNASIDASVTDLDKPTGSKSLFESIVNYVMLPFNLFFTMIAILFVIPAPVMYILTIILTFEIILVVWRLIKVGD